jgi:hypothetical protein
MAAQSITVDTRQFKRAADAICKKVLPRDLFHACNLTAATLARLMRDATPRFTGKTRKAFRASYTDSFNRPALAGAFPRKGNTAFVARILEEGRKPQPARLELTQRRDATGRRITVRRRAVSFMRARPIIPGILARAPEVMREAFRRVFGQPWPRNVRI